MRRTWIACCKAVVVAAAVGAAGPGLRGADFSESAQGTSSKPIPVGRKSESQRAQEQEEAARAASEKSKRGREVLGGAASEPAGSAVRRPDNAIEWIENNNWQKYAEIRSGKVIVLRRSTDEPVKPGETVILRWKSPSEGAQRKYLSSKGHFPNRPTPQQSAAWLRESQQFGD